MAELIRSWDGRVEAESPAACVFELFLAAMWLVVLVTRTLGGVAVRGIVGNTERTPLDECGHVYKDLDAVLRVLEAEGIAEVAQRLYPVANIKGMD